MTPYELATLEPLGLPIGLYGVVAISYILFKIISSQFYTPVTDDHRETVSVIIPEYNEDPALFERGLRSVLDQPYPIEDVWVIDDGSDSDDAWTIAEAYADEYDHVHAIRLDENQGKRHAQAEGFRRATGDIFVTMDSDTVLDEDSITNLIRPFADTEVMATTGYPRIVDTHGSFLKKLIDMRYWVAFNVERAAQSVFGTVVCCCGVLSAYRREVVLDNLEGYTTQRFLNAECTFGDDRHLTTYALREGRVVYQSTAGAQTDAPETLRGYIKQQVRWMRSFWRESLLALWWAPRRSRILLTMLVIDLLLPFALVGIGFGMVVVRVAFYESVIPILYIIIIVGVAYLRNAPYRKQDASVFIMSPIYAVLYLTMLLPLSFYALLTVRANGWGTR